MLGGGHSPLSTFPPLIACLSCLSLLNSLTKGMLSAISTVRKWDILNTDWAYFIVEGALSPPLCDRRPRSACYRCLLCAGLSRIWDGLLLSSSLTSPIAYRLLLLHQPTQQLLLRLLLNRLATYDATVSAAGVVTLWGRSLPREFTLDLRLDRPSLSSPMTERLLPLDFHTWKPIRSYLTFTRTYTLIPRPVPQSAHDASEWISFLLARLASWQQQGTQSDQSHSYVVLTQSISTAGTVKHNIERRKRRRSFCGVLSQ